MRKILVLSYNKAHKKATEILYKRLGNLSDTNSNNAKSEFFWVLFLGLSVIAITYILYLSGGTNSYIHLIYLPLIISVFVFGTRKSIVFAIFSGILVGPLLPFNVSQHTPQQPFSWILRLVMFVVIVMVMGNLVAYVKKTNDMEKNKAYEDVYTGFPNFNKLKYDISIKAKVESKKKLCLIVFEFENIETVNRYIGYDTGRNAFLELLSLAKEHFKLGTVYAMASNKIGVAAFDEKENFMFALAKAFLDLSRRPLNINGIPVAVIMKAAFIYDDVRTEMNDTLINLGRTIEQVSHSQSSILKFSPQISDEAKEYYNTLAAIYHAVKEDSFYIVYQPKTRVENNEFIGVEALLRWNDDKYKNLPISKVIQIAEDAGFIGYITKWVIYHVMKQQKEWQSEGKVIKTAINLSSRDLNDTSIISYIKECITEFQIDPSFLEFELTERSVIEDETKVFGILNELRKLGIKVSLDDYGTGYNSLMYLVKMNFCFDYIKIDKMFIDEIKNENTKTLISGIIRSAHGHGVELIAEGVEVKEQRDILQEMDCDIIQGYYYSKPLKPEDLLEYIKCNRLDDIGEEAL